MLGLKVMEMVQVAVVPDPPSAAGANGQVVAVCSKSPLNCRLEMCSATFGLAFLRVMVLAALVVPTFAVKLVIEFGVRVTGALPEPFRGIVSVCKLPSTVTTTFNVAVLVPDPVGVKFTEIPQFAGAAPREVGGEIGQVLPGSPKSPALGPEIEADVMGSGTSCSLVSVTILGGALVVPSNCAAKVSEVGATTTGFTPVALRVTFRVLTEVTIVSVPGWAPVTVGVMVTPMTQVEPA